MKELLEGKIIISTHSVRKKDEFAELLNENGATVIPLPCIEIIPLPFQITNSIETFDWIVFTSPNAIASFFSQTEISPKNKLAVLGKSTEKTLKTHGYQANYTGSGHSAIDFATQWIPTLQENEKILLVLGELAPGTLQQKLSGKAEVHRINVYKTTRSIFVDETILQQIKEDRYDLISICSPSAIHNLMGLLDTEGQKLRLVCIGQTSAKAVRQYAIEPLAITEECSYAALARTCIKTITNKLKTYPL